MPEEARRALERAAAACREALEAGGSPEARVEDEAALPRAPRQPRGASRGISWARPEGYHLTLAFLGEIDGQRFDVAADSLGAAAAFGPVEFRFSGLGGFPAGRGSGRRSGGPLAADARGKAAELRVLFARIDDGGACAALHRAVNEALARGARAASTAPLNPEWPGGRPFAPHITLARSGATGGIPPAAAGLREAVGELEGSWTIRRCALYKSELRRGGSVYTEVRGAELSGT